MLSTNIRKELVQGSIKTLIKNNREIERSIKRHKVSSKFISCLPYEKGHKSEVEYIIVEGDSAGGRAATARAKYQCILGIRGKSLNVHKASVDKLVANSEIRDIIMSLGCGIDLGIEGYEYCRNRFPPAFL